MSRRVDQPDTQADVSLRACLTTPARQSFVMVAGAGSGKTTSLIKALTSIIEVHGVALRSTGSALPASPTLKLRLARFGLTSATIRSCKFQLSIASCGN
jgi:hypothetical protein